ncbi:MAG: hypothetical protein DDT22_00770 [candidate division WS2 bacterium]|nr:hypothetical protein [Candidatus Lithacetigena glycinireducens]
MRKFIFITIFILTFIFSSTVFVEAAFKWFSPDCYRVVSVTTVEVGGFTDIYIRVGMWSLNKKTCFPCWVGGHPAWNAFVVYHNNPMIHFNPYTVWWHWVEPSVIPAEGLVYHYPKCSWGAYNHYREILVTVPVPSPLTVWPFCGETFDFKGDVYLVQEGQRYYIAPVNYTLLPRRGCEFRPSHSFVGGRGPGAKGSGATLESRGVGLGGGGLQGRGVTGYEIRYR